MSTTFCALAFPLVRPGARRRISAAWGLWWLSTARVPIRLRLPRWWVVLTWISAGRVNVPSTCGAVAGVLAAPLSAPLAPWLSCCRLHLDWQIAQPGFRLLHNSRSGVVDFQKTYGPSDTHKRPKTCTKKGHQVDPCTGTPSPLRAVPSRLV